MEKKLNSSNMYTYLWAVPRFPLVLNPIIVLSARPVRSIKSNYWENNASVCAPTPTSTLEVRTSGLSTSNHVADIGELMIFIIFTRNNLLMSVYVGVAV